MSAAVGDYLVPLYFVIGTLSMLFVSLKFIGQKALVYKNFGIGLILYALAFAVWSFVVITKPENLSFWTTVGAIPFGISHLFYLMSATDKLNASKKSMALFGALGYLVILFFLRTFVYVSEPSFSINGLFYFNAQPIIIAMYIGAFSISVLPAIDAICKNMKDKALSFTTRIGLTTSVMSSVVLVTSYDDNLQLINGWIMGAALLLLVSTYATKKIK